MKDNKLNVVKRRLICNNRIMFNCKTRSKGELTRKCFTIRMNRTFLNSTTYQNLEAKFKNIGRDRWRWWKTNQSLQLLWQVYRHLTRSCDMNSKPNFDMLHERKIVSREHPPAVDGRKL
jgi:hypothetical protein